MTVFAANIEFRIMTCSCGLTWAAPEKWFKEREQDKETFYCPNGCSRWFPQETEEHKLKRLLADEQNCCIAAREEANSFERRVVAYKGVVTKLRRKRNAIV